MGLEKQARKIGRRAVLVIWIDSSGIEGWTDDPPNLRPSEIWTLGWLLDDRNVDYVTVTATMTKVSDSVRQVNAPIVIPRCAIHKMIYLTREI